jgi:hypothetical protein
MMVCPRRQSPHGCSRPFGTQWTPAATKLFKPSEMKLTKLVTNAILKRGGPALMRPVAAMCARRAAQVADGAKPTEGIYYVVRTPEGWSLFPYRFDECAECGHLQLWEEYLAPILAQVWAGTLRRPAHRIEKELRLLTYGFPRGRVSIAERRHIVLHGNDSVPQLIPKSELLAAFSLRRGTRFVLDDHEHCQADDRDAIRGVLQIAAQWPAVSF